MATPTPEFSIVIITKNEEETLPRLLASLRPFLDAGGEFIVTDTGSTDRTRKIAYEGGAVVTEITATSVVGPEVAAEINSRFQVLPDAPVVMPGERYFDFALARNRADGFAHHDNIGICAADEVFTALDIEKINEAFKHTEQLEHAYVFAHDSQGRPELSFTRNYFYNRRNFRWNGIVHEVLKGSGRIDKLPEDALKVEHWQNQKTGRGQYLTGLAFDCFLSPEKDRQSHYFARELFYTGRYHSAIQEFRRHEKMPTAWYAERAQSCIFSGDCYARLGELQAALGMYKKALCIDGLRAEPFLRISQWYYDQRRFAECVAFASAALQCKPTGFYMENARDFRETPHHLLYSALYWMGDKRRALDHWNRCLEFEPTNPVFLRDALFFR